jgi:hypothetical protein
MQTYMHFCSNLEHGSVHIYWSEKYLQQMQRKMKCTYSTSNMLLPQVFQCLRQLNKKDTVC